MNSQLFGNLCFLTMKSGETMYAGLENIQLAQRDFIPMIFGRNKD